MTSESAKRSFPFGIIIGVAIGIALGIALKSIAIGIGVGSGLAILFGVVIAVAGLYVAGVEGQPTGWLSILANDSQAAVQFRALLSVITSR